MVSSLTGAISVVGGNLQMIILLRLPVLLYLLLRGIVCDARL